MKNYIEVVYEYVGFDGDLNEDVWYAVRPTPNSWRSLGEGYRFSRGVGESAWVICPEGNGLSLYDRGDITGLRNLLDAIEAQWVEEQGVRDGR